MSAAALLRWNELRAVLAGANSQAAAAAILFVDGKIDIEELRRFAKQAQLAELACTGAGRDYRASYRKDVDGASHD